MDSCIEESDDQAQPFESNSSTVFPVHGADSQADVSSSLAQILQANALAVGRPRAGGEGRVVSLIRPKTRSQVSFSHAASQPTRMSAPGASSPGAGAFSVSFRGEGQSQANAQMDSSIAANLASSARQPAHSPATQHAAAMAHGAPFQASAGSIAAHLASAAFSGGTGAPGAAQQRPYPGPLQGPPA